MGEDQYAAVRRTTVAEAAQILGISAEAVRGRIRRGTLPVEREGGTVYVLLEHPLDDRTTADHPRTTADQPIDRTDALIATLTQQIEDLREQVRSERQGHAEARRLLAAALERIPPQLEAPSEARESPTEAAGGQGSEVPRPGGEEAQEGYDRPPDTAESPVRGGSLIRPWWRRMFGG